jgi:hypothetical protein
MDPIDVLWALSQQPTWLGYLLLAGGFFALGLICGIGLR